MSNIYSAASRLSIPALGLSVQELCLLVERHRAEADSMMRDIGAQIKA